MLVFAVSGRSRQWGRGHGGEGPGSGWTRSVVGLVRARFGGAVSQCNTWKLEILPRSQNAFFLREVMVGKRSEIN
jgi:hypothetical protein